MTIANAGARRVRLRALALPCQDVMNRPLRDADELSRHDRTD